MLIYITPRHITKFVHIITNKLRIMNFAGIFLTVEKGLDPVTLTRMTTFVDKVIDVDKDPS